MRRPPWALLVAAGAALFHGATVYFQGLPGAFGKYPLAAELYLRGELPAERLVDFSPLYFRLWVWVERLCDAPGPWIFAFQLALAAAAVGFFFEIARRRFHPGLALALAAIFTIDRHLLVYEGIFEPEVWLLAFALGFLYFVERPGWRHALVAGVLAALCLATRPNLLPVFALVPLFYCFRQKEPWRRRALVFCVPWLLMLALLSGRAASIAGTWGAPTMNPGTVFFEGNNPLSRGTSAIYPPSVSAYLLQSRELPDSAHQHYRDVARAALGGEVANLAEANISEVNAYWSGLALASLRAEPRRALERFTTKLRFAFHAFRWHDVPTAWKYDLALQVPGVPFALISALALVGLLLGAPHWRRDFLLYALAATQLGVMLVFYVSARQRLALLPILLIFAGTAAVELWRRGRRAWLHLVLVAALVAAFALPTEVMGDELYRRWGALRVDRTHGALETALASEPEAWHTGSAVEMLASAPWMIDRLRPAFLSQERAPIEARVRDTLLEQGLRVPAMAFDLAVLELRLGLFDAAAARLEPLVAADLEFYRGPVASSEPLLYLARARALAGDREAAVELLRRARERSPGEPWVLAEQVALTDDAEAAARLRRFWGEIDGGWLLGRAFLENGRPAEAAAELHEVVSRLPELRPTRIDLAAALGASGEVEEGVRHYFAALEKGVEPVLRDRWIAELFRAWGARHPANAEVQLNAARVLHLHGHLSEALGLLDGFDDATVGGRVGVERAELRRALERAD